MAQHRLARFDEMLAEAQRFLLGDPLQQHLQPLLAGDERIVAQILAVQIEEIEGVEDQRVDLALGQGGLQGREG